MSVYFASDIHLDPSRSETYEKFMDFLHAIQPNASELYILGDLFEYWIGDDGIDLLGHRPIVEAFNKMATCGTRISIMHGNRDFLIGRRFANEIQATIIPDPSAILIGDKSILLTHGDSLCTDDIDHQRFRETVLSDEWQKTFLNLPISERQNRATEMRARSKQRWKINPPKVTDVNLRALCSAMRASKVRKIIHGHTHKPAIHQFELDGEKAVRYVLGDWDSGYDAIVKINSDGKIELCEAEKTPQ